MADKGYVHRLRVGAPGKPILFVFHGTGGDENQFFDFGSRLLPDATVVSPRGDVSEHGASRFFRRKGEGIYDMEDLARATEKMAGYVKDLAAEHHASEVLGLGYSNGANILANVLIEYGGLFDTAVLMHPLIPFMPRDNAQIEGTKVLITAGERDPISPMALTQVLADYFVRQKAETRVEWHSGGNDIRPNEIETLRAFLAPYA